MDFATERERTENSAHYLRSASEYVTTGGNGEAAAAGPSPGYLDMSSPTANAQFSFNNKTRDASVRYTKEPYLMSDLESAAPLTSDMTVNTEVTEVNSLDTRTYSVTSRLSSMGPGWRSNMQGDYGAGDTVPVSSRDLLCWAYQVCIDQSEHSITRHMTVLTNHRASSFLHLHLLDYAAIKSL